MNKQKIIELVDAYWKFDESQHPMSNWHDKQDLLKELSSLKEAEKEVSDVQDYFDLIYDNIPVNIDNCILPDYVREELANILNASIRDNLIKKG